MTPPVVLARVDWGADPVVRQSNGQPRARLVNPSTWLTVHYTGNSSPLVTKDRNAVVAAQQALELYAAGAGKPNEYNWVLYDAAGVGYVVEYAGGYVAAHSSGENDRAIGVLFYVGVGQAATDAMVDAYRYLRDFMLAAPTGSYGPATLQTPHKNMPGAATPCPGPVLDRWAELLTPYLEEVPDLATYRILVRNGTEHEWNAWVCWAGGKYWLKTNEALAIAKAELGDPVPVSDDWMIAHGPVDGENPGRDAYGCWAG